MPRRPIRTLLLVSLAISTLLAFGARVGDGASGRRAVRRGSAGAASRALDAQRQRNRLRRVEWALMSERERLRIPGLAFALVENDRVVMYKCLGVRDLTTHRAVDSLTLFPIGSCTKAFTAMAAEICKEEGKLSLDDSPHRYLPWFRMADPGADRRVTIRDMLAHRTGLRAYADLAAEPGVLSRLDYAKAATSARPVVPFREKFQYSNAMYVAVGEIVANVRRTTWEQAIEQSIFDPLQMTSSTASLAGLPWYSNHAVGYDDPNHDGRWVSTAHPASIRALAPAGAIASNARDMARWVRFLLGDGSIDGRRVLSPSGIKEVMTAHSTINPTLSYALGWALYDWNRHHVVEHNGGSQGISALVSLMPERRIGFVLLANVTPTSLTKIGNAGKILWPILLGERDATPPGATTPAAAAAAARAATAPATDSLLPGGARGVPAVDVILAKMLAAAGGEQNLRRDSTLDIRCRRSYLNQGVEADTRVRWRIPDRFESEEKWSAAYRPIGRLRVYFDGTRGGQETTFGQDQIYSGDALENARQDASLAWLLAPRRLFPKIGVLGRRRLAGEEAYVLEMAPAKGEPTVYTVSASRFLVLQRRRGGTVETYSDFRTASGVTRPFRTSIADEMGDSELVIRSIHSGATITADAFAPRVAAPASSGPGAR